MFLLNYCVLIQKAQWMLFCQMCYFIFGNIAINYLFMFNNERFLSLDD